MVKANQRIKSAVHPRAYGNIREETYCCQSTTVHPRAYGEHNRHLNGLKQFNGSSPCLREHLLTSSYVTKAGGSSRACGNITDEYKYQDHKPVHPRAYGNIHPMNKTSSLGTVHPRAYGNMLLKYKFHNHSPVHPRAYGNIVIIKSAFSIQSGSSPCLRGTFFLNLSKPFYLRFIPVPTGNMPRSINPHENQAVHPVPTGTSPQITSSRVISGSSPCLRGTFRQL